MRFRNEKETNSKPFCTFDTIDIEKFHLHFSVCFKLELSIWNYRYNKYNT